MASFLFKTEPSDYSFADLKRDKRCVWTGVSNAAALISLRTVKKGDEVYIYHTGDDKAIVGIATAVSDAYGDPKHLEKNERGEWKFAVVDLAPKRELARSISLGMIKADSRLKAFGLVKQSRLSVIPVSADIKAVLIELERSDTAVQKTRRS